MTMFDVMQKKNQSPQRLKQQIIQGNLHYEIFTPKVEKLEVGLQKLCNFMQHLLCNFKQYYYVI